MDKRVELYMQKAADCLKEAERSPDLRLDLLHIAQYWIKLADHVAGRPAQAFEAASAGAVQPTRLAP